MKVAFRGKIFAAGLSAAFTLGALGALAAAAQDPPAARQDERASAASVAPGTRFLVSIEDELATGKIEQNAKFKVKTLEPLETGNGLIIAPGAEIRGHVSRVEPAHVAGRARIWLTFDEIVTKYGKLPIVADVIGVPGDHSVNTNRGKEGEIEARRSRSRDDAEAAAAGAVIGAAAGASTGRGAKGAGVGAALGAAAGFLVSSGMGHELDLPKGSKLELELERPLHLLNK